MPDHDPIATAWQLHGTIVSWTANVDSKASFALAIQSGVLIGVVGFTGDGRLSKIDGTWQTIAFWVGIALISLALLTVTFVVRPRLRSRKLNSEIAENFIFFGHLRKWEPSDLASALSKQDLLPVLSRQLVWMSRVAWVKHRLLQVSMTAAVLGTALVVVSIWLD